MPSCLCICTPPCLLTETHHNREIVARCCERAAAVGVRPGMTLTHARALLPDEDGEHPPVHVEPLNPLRDLAALRALASLMTMRFSPIVAVDPLSAGGSPGRPDGLLLDITGCERLFRGEENLIDQIAGAIENLGFHVRIAAAPTFACAGAVARFGRRQRSRVPEDRVREALGPLPVRALGIDEEVEKSLQEVAIDRIEHLFNLPRASIPARFGEELLLRLDQALGEAIETIDPIRPAPPPTVERSFNGPVKNPQAIQITVRELLEELSRCLLRRESGVRDLVVRLDRSDLDPLRIPIALSRPSRNVRHLFSLLLPHLEKAHLGFGVERVELRAKNTGALPHEQMEVERGKGKETERRRDKETEWRNRFATDLESVCDETRRHEGKKETKWKLYLKESPLLPSPQRGGKEPVRLLPSSDLSPAHLDRALGETLDTMINRLGRERVRRLEPVESHLPERAFRFACVLEETGFESHNRNVVARSKKRDRSDAGLILPHDRPSILYAKPELIEVMALYPDGPPAWLRRRGREHAVLRGFGPQRIGAEWWKERIDGAEAAPESRRSSNAEQSDDVTCSAKYASILSRLRPWDTPPSHLGTHRLKVGRETDSSLRLSVSQFTRRGGSLRGLEARAPLPPCLLSRSYFRILLDDGRWLWVFRDLATGRWFVHGEWA